ncbi:hypothetical protein [Vagococcus acidifermentans]|uniref:Uncharacterized protein n=1 Tax=Vagococcus acidifermentans TaxID=564710 RepID=A0A430AMJ8_9ENTE|nr:hypothetical protein [Vagococcus acidifermentans]RSU09380.1 hypothetical protein CBF27_12665 [Vagococcus acidifermentans]
MTKIDRRLKKIQRKMLDYIVKATVKELRELKAELQEFIHEKSSEPVKNYFNEIVKIIDLQIAKKEVQA